MVTKSFAGNPSKISSSVRPSEAVPTAKVATKARMPRLIGSTVPTTNITNRAPMEITSADIFVLGAVGTGWRAPAGARESRRGRRRAGLTEAVYVAAQASQAARGPAGSGT